jgi:hypothetical protein
MSLFIPWLFAREGPGRMPSKIEIIILDFLEMITLPSVYVISHFAVGTIGRYVMFLVNIIYFYFLSCLVVWIYDKKFRKVRKK